MLIRGCRVVLGSGVLMASLAAAAMSARAHPHVWVTAKSEMVFNVDGRVDAVRHAWQFDDAFTAYATQGLDANGDGILTTEELQPLAEVNVTSLKEFEFFTFLALGGEDVDFLQPRDYWLQFTDGKLTLYFALPLVEPAEVSGGRLVTLDVFDPTYFVAFSFVDDDAPVKLVEAPVDCSVSINWSEGLDPMTATLLAAIPDTERDIPPELMVETRKLANTANIACSQSKSG